MEVHVSSARKRSRGPRLTRVRGSRRASSVISSDDVRGFYVLLRNSFKRKKNEVIVLSLIIRLFTCVILLGVAVCKAVRCGSKRVNAAPLLNQEHPLGILSAFFHAFQNPKYLSASWLPSCFALFGSEFTRPDGRTPRHTSCYRPSEVTFC